MFRADILCTAFLRFGQTRVLAGLEFCVAGSRIFREVWDADFAGGLGERARGCGIFGLWFWAWGLDFGSGRGGWTWVSGVRGLGGLSLLYLPFGGVVPMMKTMGPGFGQNERALAFARARIIPAFWQSLARFRKWM